MTIRRDWPADASVVPDLLVALQDAAASHLDADALDRLCLATVEAFNNIIEHGLSGMPHETIGVALRADEGTVSLVLTDAGHPFDLTMAGIGAGGPASIPATAERGRGLGIIRHCAVGLDYTRANGLNRVTITVSSAKR